MKYHTSFFLRTPYFIIGIILISIIFFYSCNGCHNNSDKAFYYSGNNEIELTVAGDTLGILLKDTVLTPGDSYKASILKVKTQLLDSNFINNQGNQVVDSLSERILLVVGTEKNKKISKLEAQAIVLGNDNQKYIANTGYLAYIKNSGTPVLVTNEIIIQFNSGTSSVQITDLFQRYGLDIQQKNPFIELQYTVSTKTGSQYDALTASQKLKEDETIIKFAQINLIYVKKFNSDPINDQFYSMQWNLSNNMTLTDVTPDADIDADLAWNFTKGSNNIAIAIIDDGFDEFHEDLKDNYVRNFLEIEGNNIDDDNNSLIDDYIGWNFESNTNRLSGGYHGTQVAGVAAAKDNNVGVRGSCPSCGIIPIRTDVSSEFLRDHLTIDYAIQRGAKIINISWDYNGTPVPYNVIDAINLATEKGIVVITAMSNSSQMSCSEITDLASLPNTISVSRSTCTDRYDKSGYGNCMDLLAPTGAENTDRGPLKVVTTDYSGPEGYSGRGIELYGCTGVPAISEDYTSCFGGTSASAPLTAGVAGLILSASGCSLTPKQVQYLLQDCADKIDPGDANYSRNGFSTGTTESRNQSTHGYGRINAYEAVKVISPDKSKGGLNGVDIFVRDNNLDWGNTEQPSNLLFESTRRRMPDPESVDIKIDASGQETPTNNDKFENSIRDELPVGGRTNKIYVRLRNRGCRTASNITIKLYFVNRGPALPGLPGDFWSTFPGNSSDLTWKPIGTKVLSGLPYSGCSIAGSGVDEAKIVSFDFVAPIPPTIESNSYCLIVMIDSPDDPLITERLRRMSDMDEIVPSSNNITYRNISIR